MIYNNAVLQSTNKVDKQCFAKVMDLCLITEEYIENNLRGTRKFPTFECHTICRAIALHIQELKVIDGHYMGVSRRRRKDKVDAWLQHCDHSWLITPSGSIIDPYPVGCFVANAMLVVTRGKYKHFGGGLYWSDKEMTKKVCTEELSERVQVLSNIISEALGANVN